MGLPGVDGVTARLLAADAVQRLGEDGPPVTPRAMPA
jgi:hypothetical protein